MSKFGSHLEAQMIDKGFDSPMNYRDDRVAWEIVEILGNHFRQLLKNRVQPSPFFGIMADETTDNSITTQLILYIKFLDQIDGEFITVIEYLDLVTPASGSAADITVTQSFKR
jgi:hypothetical protein